VLTLDHVSCGYGNVAVLRDFSLTLNKGEVLCLLGRNGAGKTTALKAIMGLVRVSAGKVILGEKLISELPAHEVPRLGIGYVPQGRRLFSELTVRENLVIGLMARGTSSAVMDRALALFPLLKDRLSQRSGTMSGGEQQMLAMARALCIDPGILLLDEPTEGLMPSMIARIQDAVSGLQAQGVATLLVEQRVDAALSVADRVAFVDHGAVRAIATAHELKSDRTLIDHYVGVGH
jgi:branched-chain amino acid transport system ATP-binding protein